MRAGKLDRLITIQAPGTTQNEIGEVVEAWTTFAQVWAYVSDISGREYVESGATQNEAQTKVQIRHIDGVVPNMRVTLGSDVYNIESVLGQDRVSLLLMCKRLTQ